MNILNAVWCACIKVINALIDYGLETITDTLGWVIALLPSVPWTFEPLQWGAFGDIIGYFIPVATMLTHFSLMLLVVVAWFSIQHILRIIRMVK